MSRIFDNTNQLSRLIVLLRLRALDPLAEALTYQFTDDGQTYFYAAIVSTLSDAAIQTLLNSAITADEQSRLSEYAAAVSNFDALPNWATWTPTQATDYIHNTSLNGWTQAQLDAWVDLNVTSIAGARLAFKQIGTAILTIRDILENLGKAVLYLRDLIIRLRS